MSRRWFPKRYDDEKVLSYLLSRGGVGPNRKNFMAMVHKDPKCQALHGDDKPKLDFSLDAQRGRCWLCGARVNLYQLVSQYEPGVRTFDEAEAFCIKLFGDPDGVSEEEMMRRDLVLVEDDEQSIYEKMLSRFSDDKKAAQKDVKLATELPDGFVSLFDVREINSPMRKMALEYAVNRGVSVRRLFKMGVGFGTKGVWRGRLVMPVLNIHDDLVMVTSRNFTEAFFHHSKTYHEGDKTTLYGINMAKRYRTGVLVEGPFDVLCNPPNFVAALGVTMMPKQIEELRQWAPDSLTIMLDPEAISSAISLAREILRLGWKSELKVAYLNPKYDPGDAPKSEVNKALAEARPVQTELDLLELETMLTL